LEKKKKEKKKELKIKKEKIKIRENVKYNKFTFKNEV